MNVEQENIPIEAFKLYKITITIHNVNEHNMIKWFQDYIIILKAPDKYAQAFALFINKFRDSFIKW